MTVFVMRKVHIRAQHEAEALSDESDSSDQRVK